LEFNLRWLDEEESSQEGNISEAHMGFENNHESPWKRLSKDDLSKTSKSNKINNFQIYPEEKIKEQLYSSYYPSKKHLSINKSVSNNLTSSPEEKQYPGKSLSLVEHKFDIPKMVACDSKANEIILKNQDWTEEEKRHELTQLPENNKKIIIKRKNIKQTNLGTNDENNNKKKFKLQRIPDSVNY
jgi:hypothetical protein